MINSYPKIYQLGHRYLEYLFDGPVVVQEKIDGSQFSFGKSDNGVLTCRSRSAEIDLDKPEKMFSKAVEYVKSLTLPNGLTYRGEYLSKPKHNTLAYDRVPRHNIIIFDVDNGRECYLSPSTVKVLASSVDLEVVPTLSVGTITSQDIVKSFLETPSILGGQKIEGVVIKNYNRFGIDGKPLMGKYVSESFKEIHTNEWKKSNPTKTDILQLLIYKYKTPARWAKAVQHLTEEAAIDGSPRDIGKLIVAVQNDIKQECGEEIKDELFKWAWEKIHRSLTSGLAEWYKERLLKNQFQLVSE